MHEKETKSTSKDETKIQNKTPQGYKENSWTSMKTGKARLSRGRMTDLKAWDLPRFKKGVFDAVKNLVSA